MFSGQTPKRTRRTPPSPVAGQRRRLAHSSGPWVSSALPRRPITDQKCWPPGATGAPLGGQAWGAQGRGADSPPGAALSLTRSTCRAQPAAARAWETEEEQALTLLRGSPPPQSSPSLASKKQSRLASSARSTRPVLGPGAGLLLNHRSRAGTLPRVPDGLTCVVNPEDTVTSPPHRPRPCHPAGAGRRPLPPLPERRAAPSKGDRAAGATGAT